MVDDEFIPADLFQQACPSLWGEANADGPQTLGLYNRPGSTIQEHYTLVNVKGDDFVEPFSVEVDESNVQKKVMPWKDTPVPNMDEDPRHDEQMDQVGLVLVASLIDKAPNLGGLCRTSQIFGVSKFVVSDGRVAEDRVFRSLSVTAEKWLPIVQVPVVDLGSYLQAMRRTGYTLVGVEQTARSRCLTQYTFPERTLLLLGHERTGIPVELIQLLDVCVEIPQQGVIRSLNVHVSGALLIWEYTRQRLMAKTFAK